MDENNKPVQPAATPEVTPASVPTPTTPVQNTQPTAPVAGAMGSKKKKSQLIIGGIIIAVVAACAVAYGVYAYVTNQPDYMLNKAVEQLGKEEVFAAKFTFTNGTDKDGTSFTGDIAARGDKATKNAEAVIGLGNGNSRVTITARNLGDTSYVRLGSLANVPNLVKALAPGQESAYDTAEFKAALSRINDKWFSLTKEEVAGVAQGATSTSGATGFKAEDLQKLVEVYSKHPFFKTDKTFADEKIDNVTTAHFSIKIDKPTYKAFLTDLKAANLETFKVTDEDMNSVDKTADDFAKTTAVEFWIARDSKKFKQTKFAGIEKGSESSLVLTMVTDLPKFDKLEKPADAVPFTEFMTLFLGPSFGAGFDTGTGVAEDDL